MKTVIPYSVDRLVDAEIVASLSLLLHRLVGVHGDRASDETPLIVVVLSSLVQIGRCGTKSLFWFLDHKVELPLIALLSGQMDSLPEILVIAGLSLASTLSSLPCHEPRLWGLTNLAIEALRLDNPNLDIHALWTLSQLSLYAESNDQPLDRLQLGRLLRERLANPKSDRSIFALVLEIIDSILLPYYINDSLEIEFALLDELTRLTDHEYESVSARADFLLSRLCVSARLIRPLIECGALSTLIYHAITPYSIQDAEHSGWGVLDAISRCQVEEKWEICSMPHFSQLFAMRLDQFTEDGIREIFGLWSANSALYDPSEEEMVFPTNPLWDYCMAYLRENGDEDTINLLQFIMARSELELEP